MCDDSASANKQTFDWHWLVLFHFRGTQCLVSQSCLGQDGPDRLTCGRGLWYLPILTAWRHFFSFFDALWQIPVLWTPPGSTFAGNAFDPPPRYRQGRHVLGFGLVC